MAQVKRIRVYLIDDHNVVREAVASLLEAEPDISVVGQSSAAREGINGVVETQANIVIIDLKMPGMSGLSAISEIAALAPAAGIVVFTMYDNPAYVWETMNSGARAYLLKSAPKED